jgi:DNA replication protein DnaC
MEKRQELEQQLKRLKMLGVWNALEMRLAEARESKLGHLEFLSLLIQDELASREDSMFVRRLKAAGFGMEKTFQEFDWHFNEKALPRPLCAIWPAVTSSSSARTWSSADHPGSERRMCREGHRA